MMHPLYAKCCDTLEIEEKPHNIQLQYAGNYGLFSLGVGKSYLQDKLNAFLIYGYLPKGMHGVTVHTFALKSVYNIASSNLSDGAYLDYYKGLGVIYGITRNTYLKYPDYFPDGYYEFPNALHLSLFLGLKLNLGIISTMFNSISFFAELATLDYQHWSAVSTKYVSLTDIWNVSFGFVFTI